MREIRRIHHWVSVAGFWGLTCLHCFAQTSPQTAQTLEQRVAGGDPSAFIEAADANRKDLIPSIEKFGGDSAAQKSLAKLGVRKYLDEIVLEATDPTNTPAAKATMSQPGVPGFPPKHVGLWVQMQAFKKLAYIKDRSTVKVLASFLYANENTDDYIERGGFDAVVFDRPSEAAMRILLQIVDNPPKISIPDGSDTHDARVKIWQQWWEQNKAKYP
jgi:hypothetical protein